MIFFSFYCVMPTGKPVSWMMIAPSITPGRPNSPNNPGLRLYKFETGTGQVSTFKRTFIYVFLTLHRIFFYYSSFYRAHGFFFILNVYLYIHKSVTWQIHNFSLSLNRVYDSLLTNLHYVYMYVYIYLSRELRVVTFSDRYHIKNS